MPNKRIFFDAMQIGDICYWYKQGKTQLEIAKIYNCSDGTIRKILLKNGVKIRPAAHIMQTDSARKKISELAKGRKWKEGQLEKMLKNRPDNSGNKNPMWKGGRTKDMGYILLRVGSEYIMEHRLVMERHIGRKLSKKEVVHHIDGNRENNKINNLVLFPSQSGHVRWHNLNTKIYRRKK